MKKAIDDEYDDSELRELVCIVCEKPLKWEFDTEGGGDAECCNRLYRSYKTNSVYSFNANNV